MSLDSSQKALKICTDKMEERRVYSAVEMWMPKWWRWRILQTHCLWWLQSKTKTETGGGGFLFIGRHILSSAIGWVHPSATLALTDQDQDQRRYGAFVLPIAIARGRQRRKVTHRNQMMKTANYYKGKLIWEQGGLTRIGDQTAKQMENHKFCRLLATHCPCRRSHERSFSDKDFLS
jgi:hypothetical protein